MNLLLECNSSNCRLNQADIFGNGFILWNMTAPISIEQIVSANPEIMSGAPVFAGTRVPVQTLFDYLEAGDSIEEFLAGFPTVSRQQVVSFLEDGKI